MELGKLDKTTLLAFFKNKDKKLQEGHFGKIFGWHSIWGLRGTTIPLFYVLTN